MKEPFSAWLRSVQQDSDSLLDDFFFPGLAADHPLAAQLAQLQQATSYCVLNGGKRLRPVLVYAAATAVNPDRLELTRRCAAAIELIHAYSLVHDDLPAMDDDDLRRGKPSLHKAFDEATAILVGDGLQARAFELLAAAPDCTAEQRVAMIETLARAAGPAGMVGGQFLDIRATNTALTVDELRSMHSLKTGALIRAALAMGGIAAGAGDEQLRALDVYGCRIGLAFQVVDDILDVEGDTATLGKTRGKDLDANKATYVRLLGLDGARAEALELRDAAIDALEIFGASADKLRELARYIVARDR